MARLPELNDAQWRSAEEKFVEAQAGDTLARETATGASASGVLGIAQLRRALANPATRGSALGGLGGVVPMQAIRLYRALLNQGALGASDVARAASTTDDLRRTIGPFELDVILEGDAAFLIIAPVTDEAPASLVLLNEDGRSIGFTLPGAVNEAVQLGMSIADERTRLALDLLRDPGTAIYIH